MIVAVALSPALDRTLVVDSLNPGSIHRPLQIVEVVGGKGFNVTRAATPARR
jgi:fructose-1-phosphate kinase PfkB-like protein